MLFSWTSISLKFICQTIPIPRRIDSITHYIALRYASKKNLFSRYKYTLRTDFSVFFVSGWLAALFWARLACYFCRFFRINALHSFFVQAAMPNLYQQ